MAEHVARMGKNLSTANAAYNQMVGSFESQVFTQARRFETLGAGSPLLPRRLDLRLVEALRNRDFACARYMVLSRTADR